LGLQTKTVLVLTNQESFARFGVFSLAYEGQLRWFSSMFSKKLVMSSNKGKGGTFEDFEGVQWDESGPKDLQHLKMTSFWWLE
jgi:hypothetical protein